MMLIASMRASTPAPDNHGPRPEAAPYRGDMNQDRGTMGQDRRDSDDHRGTPRADDQHGGADGPHN